MRNIWYTNFPGTLLYYYYWSLSVIFISPSLISPVSTNNVHNIFDESFPSVRSSVSCNLLAIVQHATTTQSHEKNISFCEGKVSRPAAIVGCLCQLGGDLFNLFSCHMLPHAGCTFVGSSRLRALLIECTSDGLINKSISLKCGMEFMGLSLYRVINLMSA